jgi:hypothetical protein
MNRLWRILLLAQPFHLLFYSIPLVVGHRINVLSDGARSEVCLFVRIWRRRDLGSRLKSTPEMLPFLPCCCSILVELIAGIA